MVMMTMTGDCDLRNVARRTTAAAVVATAGTLIAAIDPFLQLLLEKAAEEEPKIKNQGGREECLTLGLHTATHR